MTILMSESEMMNVVYDFGMMEAVQVTEAT